MNRKASYKLTDDILNALNNIVMVGGIFCDIQKAFNCVNHNILLTKLEFYGITGITHKLLKSYLKGRYQSVISNNYSSQLDVTSYLYFTYNLLNMFRTLICPFSGACDCVDGLPHRLSYSLFVVCWGLLRVMFGGVRFAG